MMSFYMDSLFAEGGTPDVRPLHTIPPTITRLYLLAMREHEREAALRCHEPGASEWRRMPDWRLDRWTIRLSLYLEERTGLEPGDRVALLSELRPEWLIGDFAALASGAVSVGIDPSLPDDAIRRALVDAQPRVLLASSEQLARLGVDGQSAWSIEHVISFDPEDADGITSLSAAIDLGGTLDTPERANAFRERAREIAPDAPALRHHQACEDIAPPAPHDPPRAAAPALTPRDSRHAGAPAETRELTQGGVIDVLRPYWSESPAAAGDVALVAGPGVDFATRLTLYTFVGDGRTCVALGDGDRLAEDAATLRPHKIVAPPAALERLVDRLPPPARDAGGGIAAMLRAFTRGVEDRQRTAAQVALGGRLRWVASTRPPDPMLADRFADAGAIVPSTLVTEVS